MHGMKNLKLDFSLTIGYIGSLEWKKKFYIRPVLGYIFIYVQIKHTYIIPDMYLTSITPLIRINGDGKPSRYAEYPANSIFL